MPTFRYNKLVRDGIVENMVHSGESPEYRVLGDAEYIRELINKLAEESQELAAHTDTTEIAKELADLQEVLDCLREALGVTAQQVNVAKDKKHSKVGSFKKRLFVMRASPSNDNPWVAYLRANPKRYPEEP